MSALQLPSGFSWATDIQLGSPEVYNLSRESWPAFLLEESDIPDPLLKFQISAHDFKEKFKAYGIRHDSSKKLAAFVQVVCVKIDETAKELPDLGWRFSIKDASLPSAKNSGSLVEASVANEFRGAGLSKLLLQKAKIETKKQGYNQLIAPVRPTMKKKFPLETMRYYCERKNSQGDIFDPWLRTHLEAGATLLNICHTSVCVTASLQKWRKWLSLPLLDSGAVNIPEGIMPLKVDTSTNIATYTEPNIWVWYDLTRV